MKQKIPLLLLALLATGAVRPAAAANVQPPPIMAGTGAAPLPESFRPAVIPGQTEAPGCRQRHAHSKDDRMAEKGADRRHK